MEVSGHLNAPAGLPQGKSPWNPSDRRLGRSQSRSKCGDEKNSQPLPGIESPIIQPVPQRYTTELSRFLEGLRKVTKQFGHNNRPLDPYYNPVPCKHEARLLTTQSRRSVFNNSISTAQVMKRQTRKVKLL
jgi:hypothetical protein